MRVLCSWSVLLVSSNAMAELVGIDSGIVKGDYGVDVSYPMQHGPKHLVSGEFGDREAFYKNILQGCVDYYNNKGEGEEGEQCVEYESDRIEMNLRQPQSMQNYTKLGFMKIKTPDTIWKKIKQFWDDNRHHPKEESWGTGNAYTNHWESMTQFVNIEDTKLRGGGSKFQQEIWDMARGTIEEWTGEELEECSLYGIRIYTEGNILAPHVDRLPLVSSAIINVDADVDEPWPLEVISHEGIAYNVTMKPGEMVLYESHSIIHGRPFPLKGRFVANLFVHFEPTGHSLRHNAKMKGKQQGKDGTASELGEGETEERDGLPPYIIPGSLEEKNWRAENESADDEWEDGEDDEEDEEEDFVTGSTVAHDHAFNGHLKKLMKEIARDRSLVHAQDSNGWAPLHEAVRGGHFDVVKYLHEQGADLNARTHDGYGGSPLWIAIDEVGEKHPVVKYLQEHGAEYIEPEL